MKYLQSIYEIVAQYKVSFIIETTFTIKNMIVLVHLFIKLSLISLILNFS